MALCREVTRVLAGDQLESTGPLRRLWIRFHLLICAHCRRYARQIVAIGAAARSLFTSAQGAEPRLVALEASIVERLVAGQKPQ